MNTTTETLIDRQLLKAAVMRQIFCHVTKAVLDVRTAVLVTVTHPSGRQSAFCVTGTAWDRVAGDFTAARDGGTFTAVDVLDGRQLHRRRR